MATRHRVADTDDGEALTLSPAEAREAFDQAARHWLGVSGEEVLRAWDADDYGPDPDRHAEVMRVAMPLPWAR